MDRRAPNRASSVARTGNDVATLGPMVRRFPEPSVLLQHAMDQLQTAELIPPIDPAGWHQLAEMPRPWDPASLGSEQRLELWAWLDDVAAWINEQHLWNLARPGIPECWPAHPPLVHDLAVLACTRYYTNYAANPGALDDWHAHRLAGFLERLRDRLDDACQPSRHAVSPRLERNSSYRATASSQCRRDRYLGDALYSGPSS